MLKTKKEIIDETIFRYKLVFLTFCAMVPFMVMSMFLGAELFYVYLVGGAVAGPMYYLIERRFIRRKNC